ncbi:spliceosome-associated protein CWC27 homolog [Oppia nitens]|uniref:spliceosome-associated protein CWC27 homolog n=1 Tax=Oppia nitens TaxID=1686743 RepID=UPI0023DB99F5|nr:spliceosome-associated protein CWC27 homolog [Oppia nitens]
MSNIYIQEPPTNGKVLLKTSVGDIDIELWSRECPKTCRNFIQLCLEGYYDNNIFHRLVKGFIVQTGDPTGTGMGGESIYGQPFKDELHSRLRFVRRGLVAMANSGVKDDNTSQFFFTLDSCLELQNKHTIFGKVTGNTIYNMIKLEESEVDQNERPLHPYKIHSTEILLNPFPDIIPRQTNNQKKSETKVEQKSQSKATKNFNLLSFGDEAEEEEEEIISVSKDFKGKSKSSHDLLKDDPKLSSLPAVDTKDLMTSDSDREDEKNNDSDENLEEKSERLDRIKAKLKKEEINCKKDEEYLDKDEEEFFKNEDMMKIKKQESCLSKVRDEFKALKKQMCSELKKKCEKISKCKVYDNPAVKEFIEEAKKYKEATNKLPKKGHSRESLCLSLLEKFKTRLLTIKEGECSEGKKDDSDWLSHQMVCHKEEEKSVLAKDANLKNDEEWYDIHDPRNPINKRRREEGLEKHNIKKTRVN